MRHYSWKTSAAVVAVLAGLCFPLVARAELKAGWNGKPRHLIDPARYAAFFEAHIEQGDTLESSGQKIGVETAIVYLALQVTPTTVGRRSQGVELHDGEELVARSDRTVTILP